jgi:hypothetical protein
VEDGMGALKGERIEEQVIAVCKVLEPYRKGEKELTGFYDIEATLDRKGVDRGVFISIAERLFALDGYEDLIKKFNTGNSPCECRTFVIPM